MKVTRSDSVPLAGLKPTQEAARMKQVSPYTYSSALGDTECVAGSFRVELPGWTFTWSDGMYQLHGYQRGEVVPSVALLFAHKHPDDRAKCRDIVTQVAQDGGYFCMYHRIIDARGRTRRVLSSGDAILDASGKVVAMEGIMVDLTTTLQRETEQSSRDAVAGALSTRSVVDQACGILMGQLKISAESAFKVLARNSSHRNIKLVVVATELVQLAGAPQAHDYLDAAVRALAS